MLVVLEAPAQPTQVQILSIPTLALHKTTRRTSQYCTYDLTTTQLLMQAHDQSCRNTDKKQWVPRITNQPEKNELAHLFAVLVPSELAM